MTTWSYFRGPDVFDIKVGYRCNNACIHCIVEPVRRHIGRDGSRLELDTEQVEDLIGVAAASGTSRVVLTGGEVSIRPDFERLLRSASSRGLRIVVQTNGRMLSHHDLCARVGTIPNVSFMVALHGSTARTHDAITRRPGSFDETCDGIRNLHELHSEIVVKLVLLRPNQGDALATTKLAERLGADRMCVVFPHASDFSSQHMRSVIARYADLQRDTREVCLHSESERFPTSFENFPYCTVSDLPQFWARNCDLRSTTSSQRVPPAATHGRFDWEDLRQTMKFKGETCRACVFDRICEGPWREYVRAYGFDAFQPVRPHDVPPDFLAALTRPQPPPSNPPPICTCGRTERSPLCSGRHASAALP